MSGFTFKRFHIAHDRCAMKVGTDGVLLGSWTPCDKAQRILDIGSGSGLLSLMLAQRTESTSSASIDAVEIDAAAAAQSHENVARSPWPDRIRVHHESIQSFSPDGQYDLIISNPPYYCAGQVFDRQRMQARHQGTLSLEELMSLAATHATTHAKLSLVLPQEKVTDCLNCAANTGWHLKKQTRVKPLPDKPVHRSLLLFSRFEKVAVAGELLIEQTPGQYSAEYRAITQDFYLRSEVKRQFRKKLRR